jgi:hypothetical protein
VLQELGFEGRVHVPTLRAPRRRRVVVRSLPGSSEAAIPPPPEVGGAGRRRAKARADAGLRLSVELRRV